MPLYFVMLAGWFKAFGVSFLTMRSFSVLWGVVLIGAGYVILRSITRDPRVALLGVVLLAFNYDIINFASARYDIMVAALNLSGIAAYLHYREKDLQKGVLLANTLLAAACLTHPYALFGLAGLSIFALFLDRNRLRLRHFLVAGLPYIVAGSAWGLYIIQDVEMFRSQLASNSTGRLSPFADPLRAVYSEIHQRYIVLFGGWREGTPLVARVKVLSLAFYGVGIAGCLFTRRLRSAPGVRALLAYVLTSFLLLTFFEGKRWYIYLVYIIPLYALVAAVFLGDLVRRGGAQRLLALSATACFVFFTVATVAFRASLDVHGRAFVPASEYLRQNIAEGQLVMAGGEFGLGLGFARHVLDDAKLGFVNGRVPDYIVISPVYAGRHEGLARSNPEQHAHVQQMLGKFEPVFTSRAGDVWYTVLRHRDLAQ
jgi:4-amino-4-deoxy-L-arabinose transferase-like glycosyltransferase